MTTSPNQGDQDPSPHGDWKAELQVPPSTGVYYHHEPVEGWEQDPSNWRVFDTQSRSTSSWSEHLAQVKAESEATDVTVIKRIKQRALNVCDRLLEAAERGEKPDDPIFKEAIKIVLKEALTMESMYQGKAESVKTMYVYGLNPDLI